MEFATARICEREEHNPVLPAERATWPGHRALQPSDQFVRIRILHQRKSEPFLAEVLDGRTD